MSRKEILDELKYQLEYSSRSCTSAAVLANDKTKEYYSRLKDDEDLTEINCLLDKAILIVKKMLEREKD